MYMVRLRYILEGRNQRYACGNCFSSTLMVLGYLCRKRVGYTSVFVSLFVFYKASYNFIPTYLIVHQVVYVKGYVANF